MKGPKSDLEQTPERLNPERLNVSLKILEKIQTDPIAGTTERRDSVCDLKEQGPFIGTDNLKETLKHRTSGEEKGKKKGRSTL